MKKFVLMAVMAVASLTASAQWYVGGGLNLNIDSPKNGSSTTKFSLSPEAGYSFNDKWGAGLALTLNTKPSSWEFHPYARYTFAKSGAVNFFCDGGLDFCIDGAYDWGVSIAPGIAYSICPKVTVLAKTNLLNFQSGDFGSNFHLFGNTTKLTISAYFNI